jgi:hypothetical protein
VVCAGGGGGGGGGSRVREGGGHMPREGGGVEKLICTHCSHPKNTSNWNVKLRRKRANFHKRNLAHSKILCTCILRNFAGVLHGCCNSEKSSCKVKE